MHAFASKQNTFEMFKMEPNVLPFTNAKKSQNIVEFEKRNSELESDINSYISNFYVSQHEGLKNQVSI